MCSAMEFFTLLSYMSPKHRQAAMPETSLWGFLTSETQTGQCKQQEIVRGLNL